MESSGSDTNSINNMIEDALRVMEQMLVGNVMFVNQGMNPCNEQAMGRMKRCTLKPKLAYDERVKFSFYGCTGKCNHHNGVIVIASAVDVDKRVCHYGTAYCSPKDVYSKEKGKEIAYNDMLDNRYTVALGKKTHHEINARIFADIVANNDAPSWARNKVATALHKHLQKSFNVFGWDNA